MAQAKQQKTQGPQSFRASLKPGTMCGREHGTSAEKRQDCADGGTVRTSRRAGLRSLFYAWLAAALFTCLLALGVRPVEASPDTGATSVDAISTGSIATSLHAAGTALAGAQTATVHVPDSLSVLADRRLLVVLAAIGLAVVWINRLPPNRDKS
ncbi:hypothetical protein ACQ3G6_12175 [Allorhizobium undicola]